ncbi:MAG: hypothetical protein IKN48_06030 [Bacteroidaceae bacterium]|nr:hypothetical protein [Bacteroidaceae bacterium]
MKLIRLILCALMAAFLLPSCSSDEVMEEVSTRSAMSIYDLMKLGEGKFYYYKGFSSETTFFLKKEKGDWVVTKLDVQEPEVEYTEEELRDGILDSHISRDFFLIFPYGRMMFPDYFWFDGGKVYSDYTEITSTYPDWQLGDFYYSDIEPFLDYLATTTEKTSDIFRSAYWLSMLNHIEIRDGNILKMSFSEHPLRLARGADYNYVLEEADETKLVIRVELKESRFGCDAVRLIYKAISQRPKYYKNFNSKEEAKQFIDDILSMLKES